MTHQGYTFDAVPSQPMTEEKEENSKGISRRKFIQGTTTGVALMAGGALLSGAVPAVHAQSASSAAAEHNPTTAGLPTMAESTFTGPTVGSTSLPTTWDKTVDVLVVGASGAGMAAAIEATEAGSNTLIIDKLNRWGGLFIAAAGSFTIGGNNHVQQAQKITGDSIQLWYMDEMKGTDYRAVPEIIRTYVEHGDDFLYWFESLGAVWANMSQGVESVDYNGKPGPYRGFALATSSNYPPANQSPFGFSFVYLLKKRVDALNVPILLQTRMTNIWRQPNGPVYGVSASTPTGTINIKATQAVILATGGTAQNTVFCKAWDTRLNNDTYHDGINAPGQPQMFQNTGDGHLCAMAVGAGLTDMNYDGYLPSRWGSHTYAAYPVGPNWWDGTKSPNITTSLTTTAAYNASSGLSIGDGSYVIVVKGDGARFVNENAPSHTIPVSLSNDPYAPNDTGGLGDYSEYPEHQFIRAYLNLPVFEPGPRNCWAVADSAGAKALSWSQAAMTNPDPTTYPALYPDACAVAPDLNTLAVMMGVDPVGLAATVAKYNGYVANGADPDFGKPKTQLVAQIGSPPFFAAKMTIVRHTQRNGIRINSKAQIIDQIASAWDYNQGSMSGNPITGTLSVDTEPVIPHLYAAGECAGGFGWRRYHNTLACYMIYGRIAGQNAATESRMT